MLDSKPAGRTATVAKRFFISHSSPEKPLALELKKYLDDDAWVDLHEIDLGDILLNEISAGIEAASDFVLLWSAASAESNWVQFEFHMAFIRWLEDNAVAIRVVRLDETPVPLHIRPFLQARQAHAAEDIANVLSGLPPRTIPRRTFFNRNVEIGAIEDALYSPAALSLWLCGIPGSGKRTLAREAINRITAGTGATLRVGISGAVAERELNLLVSSAMAAPPADEAAPLEDVISHTASQLGAFVSSGGIWVFEDAEHWLEDNGTFGRMAEQVFAALSAAAPEVTSRVALFTSRRRPQVSGPWDGKILVVQLRGLANQHAIPLLRSRSAKGTDEELAIVCRELDGHPLALEVVAPQLPVHEGALAEQRYSIASDLIDPTRLSRQTWRLLESLSLVDGPISNIDLANFMKLESEQFQSSVGEATEYALVEFSDLGYMELHPLLRDYFLRSYRKQPDHTSRTVELAEISRKRFGSLDTKDPQYVQSLLATVRLLALAGKFDEARSLRHGLTGTLLNTAVELYQEKRYEEALKFANEALTGDDTLDREALLLKAKILAYLGDLGTARKLGDQLVASNPTSPKVLRDRGRIEFIDRQWSAAIGYFEQAIALRRNNPHLWADIAQARIRMEDWPAASVAAKTAIESGGDTPYALSLYSQALEQQSRYEEAETMMARAVKREPNNPVYRHRLGRIAQQRGNRELAISQFKSSVEIDPTYVDSWLSLASMLADARDFDGARRALVEVEQMPAAPLAVIDNVKAKIALILGQLDLAQDLIDSAIRRNRDPRNLTLAVRIAIARAENKEMSIGHAQATVRQFARELDNVGHLADVLEYDRQYPQYFRG